MKTLKTILIILIIIYFHTDKLMCQWTKIQTGLTGENVISLAIKTNGYIYAGTNTNGAYKSTDNANSWTLVLGQLYSVYQVFSLTFDAPGNVYAGTHLEGLLRSTDEGGGWSYLTSGLPQNDVRVVAISPTGTFFASDFGSIYRSTDNGSSWNEVRHSSGGSSGGFQTIAFGSSRVYAGGSNDWLYYSTNDGINWTWVGSSSGLSHPPLTLAVNGLGYVFAGTSGGGVFRSTNLGLNWTAMNTDLGNLNINTIAINSSDVIYVGTTGGVYVSTDDGSHWISNNSGLTNTNIRSLAFDYLGNVYAGAFTGGDDGGLWKSIAILPVELTSFTACVIGNAVKLSWETETEVNNYGFEIERSKKLDARSETWEKIGFVNGNGNSNSPKSYFYEDNNVTAGKYSYRLKQIDNDGKFEYSKAIEVNLTLPAKFELSQNYPNPFNPSTVISYQLPVSGNVTLKVFDVLGNEVATLVNEEKPAGEYEVEFSPESSIKHPASGIYFYQLRSREFIQTKKMILMK